MVKLSPRRSAEPAPTQVTQTTAAVWITTLLASRSVSLWSRSALRCRATSFPAAEPAAEARVRSAATVTGAGMGSSIMARRGRTAS
jgi:hypothetical protein